jgi:asparagine synthase (glutamine-hydrolysing)
VDEQLVSDVPLGATVSGGLDSSTVVLLADHARVRRDDGTTLHLFAYHDDRAEEDERLYQAAVLDSIRSPHAVHWVSSSPQAMAARFDHYVHHQEEPYADVSSYAEYCLAEAARQSGVKVLLSGMGGDEIFVGYVSFLGPLLLDLPPPGRLPRRAGALERGSPGARPSPGVRVHSVRSRLPPPAGAAAERPLGRAQRTQGRSSGERRTASAGDAWRTWHVHDGRGPTNAALRGAIESWCIPRFLLHSDRMGLAHGIEGRCRCWTME